MQYGMKKNRLLHCQVFMYLHFGRGDICVKLQHMHVQCAVTK